MYDIKHNIIIITQQKGKHNKTKGHLDYLG